MSEANSCKDRVVVREVAAHHLAILVLRPVAVGKRSISANLGRGSYEDVIDTLVGPGLRSETVVCAVLGEPSGCIGVTVFKHAGTGEQGIQLISLRNVEIACQHCQLFAAVGHLGDTLHYQLGRFTASFHADVVHVKVEEYKFLFGLKVAETSPAADAVQCCVPAYAGLLWRLAEPEVAFLKQLHAFWVVENSGVFALPFAIIAPYAYPAIGGQALLQVHQLLVQHLLCSEDVGVLPDDLVADVLAALMPTIAVDAILLVLVSYVVAAYGELLGSHAYGAEEYHDECADVFHVARWCDECLCVCNVT